MHLIRQSCSHWQISSFAMVAFTIVAAQSSAWAAGIGPVETPGPQTPNATFSGSGLADSVTSPTPPLIGTTTDGFTISGPFQGTAADTTVVFHVDTTQEFKDIAAGQYVVTMFLDGTFQDITNPSGDGHASVTYGGTTFVQGFIKGSTTATVSLEPLLLPSTAALRGSAHSESFYFGGGNLTLIQNATITFDHVLSEDVLTYHLPQGGSLTAVPEPSSLALFGIGAGGLIFQAIRRRRQTFAG